MDFVNASLQARERIAPFIHRTTLEHSRDASEQTGARVYLKFENQQRTGSFKVRGALNRLLALRDDERERGITAASSGNHGLGVAYGLSRFSIPGTIYVPENAAPAKVDAIRRLGAEVVVRGATCEVAEEHAREAAEASGRTFISPYNDPWVVAGQGTIGLELAEAGAQWDAVFLSVGCGGLAAGVAGVLKTLQPAVKIFGCSPVNDCAMATSVRAGKIVECEARPTLSDGTAGGVEADSITFDYCRELVDEFVLVEEAAIAQNLRWLLEYPHQLVEGAAAVALAGMRQVAPRLAGANVAVILCGANISVERLRLVLGS